MIGILSLQGGFAKHFEMLKSLGADCFLFREISEIPQLSGLILPGGESTTIGMLLERRGLIEPLRQAIQNGLPVFGTCAGAILLSNKIAHSEQIHLGGLDATISRNAYGSQIDSFEANLDFAPTYENTIPIPGIFIRAPLFTKIGPKVKTLIQFNDSPVLVQEKQILAASFHPELTNSTTIHQYFLEMISNNPVN